MGGNAVSTRAPSGKAGRRGRRALDLARKVAAIGDRVPRKEWDKLPPDWHTDHDHYLYGSPKKARKS
jgi:hypothetical protein